MSVKQRSSVHFFTLLAGLAGTSPQHIVSLEMQRYRLASVLPGSEAHMQYQICRPASSGVFDSDDVVSLICFLVALSFITVYAYAGTVTWASKDCLVLLNPTDEVIQVPVRL